MQNPNAVVDSMILKDTLADNMQVGIEIQKSFLVASEKDMRLKANLARVPKMALRGVPSIQVPKSAGGEEETLYLFKDTEAPERKAVLKVFYGSVLSQRKMNPENHLYENQGMDMQIAAVAGDISLSSLASHVHKDQSLWTYHDFVAKFLHKRPEEDGTDTEVVDAHRLAHDGEEVALVGPVAEDFATPTKEMFKGHVAGGKNVQQGLKRIGSRESGIASAAGSETSSTVAGSTVKSKMSTATSDGGAADQDDDDDEMGGVNR